MFMHANVFFSLLGNNFQKYTIFFWISALNKKLIFLLTRATMPPETDRNIDHDYYGFRLHIFAKHRTNQKIQNKFGCGKHKQRMIAFKECGSKWCRIIDKMPQSHPNIYYWQTDALIWNATNKRWNLSWQKMIARKKSMCGKKCMQPISAR